MLYSNELAPCKGAPRSDIKNNSLRSSKCSRAAGGFAWLCEGCGGAKAIEAGSRALTLDKGIDRPSSLSDAGFPYKALPIVDLDPACSWTPSSGGISGSEANTTIVATYMELDRSFDLYLGEPGLSNWLTFGKHSARQVGGWIRDLEGIWSLLASLSPSASGVKPSIGERVRAVRSLLRLVQASPGAGAAIRAFGRLLYGLGRDGGSGRAAKGSSWGSWIRAISQAPRRLMESLAVVRRALVAGNTELYGRLAYAFNLFLDAESKGLSGVAAVAEKIQSGRLVDPTGDLIGAFVKYRSARKLGLRADASGISAQERASLLARRRKLIYDANVMIAVQEQSFVLQSASVFGDPLFHSILGALNPGDLSLSFPREGAPDLQFQMLPDGGNWADFAARMGFRRVQLDEPGLEQIFTVVFKDKPEEVQFYAIDWEKTGTIVDLVTNYFDGPRSEVLRGRRPASA